MSKKKFLLTLIILSIPSSFVCFYATNLILSDVANMFYMTITKDVISSLPIFLIAVEFVMASINILHYCTHPDEQKRLLHHNAAAIAVISLIGASCSILSGIIIYGSFTAPYPFPGATILTLLFHIVLSILALITASHCRDYTPLNETVWQQIGRALHWFLMAVFIYYAFDRFGAFLWMPTYVQFSTLNKTFWFYLSLMLPVCLLIHHCRYRLNLYRNKAVSGILFPLIYLAADILLCAAVVTGGINNTQFVAAISPALGIERLLSKPIITIVHFSLMTLPILSTLTISVLKTIKRHRQKPA